jgi:GNAT superfamily N-acetyltransferase
MRGGAARDPSLDGLEVRPFSAETEAGAVRLINGYTANWAYTRPVNAQLVAYWKTLGERRQPGHMLVAYREGTALCFLHGERERGQHFVHLLALVAGAASDGAALLRQVEEQARRDGVRRICGPTCVSGRFYGGYLLGLEPYHPHWAVEATEAFVQAGFAMNPAETLLTVAPAEATAPTAVPPGYTVEEGRADAEYEARTFRLVACFGGEEVATCGGRVYPELRSDAGLPIGQLGFVGTADQHRGKGLATALVTRSLERLREWGTGLALVSTGLGNAPALRAYERAGFRRKHLLIEWSKLVG